MRRRYASPSEKSKAGFHAHEEIEKLRYEERRTNAPLTFKKPRKKQAEAVQSGIRCDGCGASSSQFSTRRLFREHRSLCEAVQ